jgi:hypothetical protein
MGIGVSLEWVRKNSKSDDISILAGHILELQEQLKDMKEELEEWKNENKDSD